MSEPFTLSGKSVIVTGASMGIGETAARICLEAGARVTLCARGGEALDSVIARFEAMGYADAVTGLPTDVSRKDDVPRLFDRAQESFGEVDGVIHAAAVLGPIASITEVEPDAWLETVHIDLFGTFLVVREACRRMRDRGGRIALFAGGGASAPFPKHTAYACSKVAVVRFTETVALEMHAHDIEINCIAPGLVATRMTAGKDISNAVSPEYGARAAAFLVSDAAKGINGKFVAAVHDDYVRWHEHPDALHTTDIFTLRRILPRERGMDWQ